MLDVKYRLDVNLTLPHGVGQTAGYHKDAQLEERHNQAAPADEIRIGFPEIGERATAAGTH